jgi:hypothetical protein
MDVAPSYFGKSTMVVRAPNESGTEIDRFTLLR